MQLQKYHWKRNRASTKFTEWNPTLKGFLSRHGRSLSNDQHMQQINSRLNNPKDILYARETSPAS